jgi:hypothetical protein
VGEVDEIFKGQNIDLNSIEPKNIDGYKIFECCLAEKLIRKQTYKDYTCYLFNLDEDGFYLFGKENNLNQKEVINEISKLNNELTNKTRELNKKNLKLELANKKINGNYEYL